VVRDQIRDKLPYPFEDKGDQSVKNIARSVRVFALRPEAVAELPSTSVSALAPRRRHLAPIAMATAGIMALMIAVLTWWVWPTTRSSQFPPAAVGSAGDRAPAAASGLQPAALPVVPQRQVALWDAVIAGNVTEAILSIRAGADVNGLDTRAEPNGRRPLNWAAIRNDTAMISALLDAGANINSANLPGFTPLHHAGEFGSKEAAILLITRGANLALRNRNGQTPEQTAGTHHHPEVEENSAPSDNPIEVNTMSRRR